MTDRVLALLRRADPISWEISFAAWTLIGVLVVFAVLESLPIGTWQGRVLMWLVLAVILTVVCRVQRIRYRDLATLLVPAVLLLAVTPFAADNTLRLISTFVIFFGAIAIPVFPTTLVLWIGFVAPDYYRAIGEADEMATETFASARDAVHDELATSEGDPTMVTDTVSAARQSMLALGPIDADWENVRLLFLRYLDWYAEVTDPAPEDWAERRSRLNAAAAAYEAVLKSRSQSVGHRIVAAMPSAG